jgi:hypothetical protein
MVTNSESPQRELLNEALKLLVVAHYVLAGITFLLAPAFLYLAWSGWSMLHPERGQQWTPMPGQEILDPVVWGAAFFAAGVLLGSLCLMHAGLIAYVGRSITRRKRRLFCLIFSCFDLTYIPLGTALGIFAIVLLRKPAVKEQFDATR